MPKNKREDRPQLGDTGPENEERRKESDLKEVAQTSPHHQVCCHQRERERERERERGREGERDRGETDRDRERERGREKEREGERESCMGLFTCSTSINRRSSSFTLYSPFLLCTSAENGLATWNVEEKEEAAVSFGCRAHHLARRRFRSYGASIYDVHKVFPFYDILVRIRN